MPTYRRFLVFLFLGLATGAVVLLLVFLRLLEPSETPPPPAGPAAAVAGRSLALARCRRRHDPRAQAAFLAEQGRLARSATDPAEERILAEALLEWVNATVTHRGLVVGRPAYTRIPREVDDRIDAALAHVRRARERGDLSGENLRIEASLLSFKITGLASALRWGGKSADLLARARKLEPNNPRIHVALGCRKLFTPPFLGQDLAGALSHFSYAAKALPDDERPLLFAALARHLLGEKERARELALAALARAPANFYTQAVVERMKRGAEDPFTGDATRPGSQGEAKTGGGSTRSTSSNR